MKKAFNISSVLFAVSLLLMAPSTAEATPASKPKEIVVVGSKLMEIRADLFAQEAQHVLNVWVPLIEFLRDSGRDGLAEEAYQRVSERLRHKSRAAMAHVNRIMWHSLDLLARHGGTLEDESAVRQAADSAIASIEDNKLRAIAILQTL